MSELLVEIFSEEIPPMLQRDAGKQFVRLFQELAKTKGGISGFTIDYYVTPRRLILVVDELPDSLTKNPVSIRGPKVGAHERAISGFLGKYQLNSVDDLNISNISGQEYYLYETPATSEPTSGILPGLVIEVIQQLVKFWPKTMRWGEYDVRWVRPIHNILAVYAGEALDFRLWHFQANNKTKGHRYLGDGDLTVKNFNDYRQQLLKNGVEISSVKRSDKIALGLNAYVKQVNCSLIEDSDLLEEVSGLVEYPVVMMGQIPDEFMTLPEAVLVTAMKKHQRYFALRSVNGDIAPYFLFVSNISASNDGVIVSGNEKVLAARLSDAQFFYKSDNDGKLEDLVDLLANITFHKDIGNMLEKSHNIEHLAKLIAMWVPHADLLEVETASKICKADLTTEMVGEFPELQGVIGFHYARAQNYSENVAVAMKEHYLPLGMGVELPRNPVSICLALADKLDNLVSLFAIGERPTGSKDPYAIRRQAIGIIRIILEGDISFPFNLALEKAVQPYASLAKAQCKKKLKGFFVDYGRMVSQDVLNFVFARLCIILKEQGLSDEVINAVYNDGVVDDFLVLRRRAQILQDKLKEERFQDVVGAYKRAYSIHSKAAKLDGCSYDKKPHKLAFKSDVEKDLYRAVKQVRHDSMPLLKTDGYAASLDSLEIIITPVNRFFDQVKVNDDDTGIRENRLKLLAYLCSNVNKLANFSCLESQI